MSAAEPAGTLHAPPRPDPLPPAAARPPSRQRPGPARGDRPGSEGAAAAPPGPAAPAAALTRSSGRRSLRRRSHRPRARLPRWLLPPQTLARARGQFENGAERPSQPARRGRRRCPGNGSGGRSGALRRRARRDGGAGPRCPETDGQGGARPQRPQAASRRGTSADAGVAPPAGGRWASGSGLTAAPAGLPRGVGRHARAQGGRLLAELQREGPRRRRPRRRPGRLLPARLLAQQVLSSCDLKQKHV